MTLYEYLKEHKEDEITMLDYNYDCEIYWYWTDTEDMDKWDKALMKIARFLNVTNIIKQDKVVCNLSELIQHSLTELKNANMFYSNDIYDIMYDMENVFSGYVSEKWMSEFARIICYK